jgi:hypothetical protein
VSSRASVALVALALAGAPEARADDVSRAELERLAARAATSETARRELLRIDSVDGRPVALRQALAGASDNELAARAAALVDARPGAPPASAAEARDAASEILSERRFRRSELPRPLHGFLAWVGERLRPLGRPFAWLADRVPGGNATLWALLGAAVVAVATVVALRLAARRSAHAEAQRRRAAPATANPRRLEREAEAAERRGELERALRLRFRAGLLRLDEQRRIRFSESVTTREIAGRLRSAAFDELAASFDRVVYGRRSPTPADLAAARERWQRVLAEAA